MYRWIKEMTDESLKMFYHYRQLFITLFYFVMYVLYKRIHRKDEASPPAPDAKSTMRSSDSPAPLQWALAARNPGRILSRNLKYDVVFRLSNTGRSHDAKISRYTVSCKE